MRFHTGLITLSADDTEKKMHAVTMRCWAKYDLISAKMTEQLQTILQAKYPEDSIVLEHIERMKKHLRYIREEEVMMLLREVVSEEKAQDWAAMFDAVQDELEDAKVTVEVGLGEDAASIYSVEGGETYSVEGGEEILL